MEIGKIIETLRTDMGLSQEAVAERLDITKQAIWKYENNKITNIPMDKIKELSNIFHVTPAMIMGWESTMFSHSECCNRLEFIDESALFSSDCVIEITKMDETDYLEYKKRYMVDPDKYVYEIANKLNLPYNFIIGEAYETTIPFTEWRWDRRQDWLSANDAGKKILECRYGKPVFQKKAHLNIDSIASSSEQETALLQAFRGTTDEGRLRIIQAVLNICDEIERKETIVKSQKTAG